ncbi:MAG: CorA family divalent cation transporter, partial [Candidatus Woesearchaeota archaeon]
MMQIFFYDIQANTISQEFSWPVKKGFYWVRLVKPDYEELKSVSDNTGISLEELTQAGEDPERSKIVPEGKFIQLVYQTPQPDEIELFSLRSVTFFVGKDQVITVEHKTIQVFEQAANNLELGKMRFLLKRGAGKFTTYFLDKINDEFLKAIEKIGTATRKITLDMKKAPEEHFSILYQSNLSLSAYNHALLAN